MKFTLLCIAVLLLLRKVSSLLKVLDDSEVNCTGLICDYSFIAWKEKIEILQANNELRNIIADGYSADITTAAINKLAWSEKLSMLAQDQANQCPGSKVWTYAETNGECEYASAKRVRRYSRLHKNFSSFVDENRMMDVEGDSSDRTKKKLRRGSAYSIGCGYVLRYSKDKLIDHFVCLYCYVNKKHDYISFDGNRSCQQDCLYENFTCDRFYSRLCSYEGKDGNIDPRYKSNPLCPEINLLAGSVLFWNFLGNNVVCLLAAIFILTSIICSVVLAVYFSVKNYDHWKKYFVGKGAVDVESEVLGTSKSTAGPKLTSTPPPPVASTMAPKTPVVVPPNDTEPFSTSTSTDRLTAYALPLQRLQEVEDLKPLPGQELPKIKKSRKNMATCPQNDIKSNAMAAVGTGTSGHKVNKTAAAAASSSSSSSSKRSGTHIMVVQGASRTTQGVGVSKNCKNRISDPIYGQRDNGGTNKRSKKVGTSVKLKPRQQQLGGGWRGS